MTLTAIKNNPANRSAPTAAGGSRPGAARGRLGTPLFLHGSVHAGKNRARKQQSELKTGITHSRGRGSSLPQSSRQKYENKLGSDFSQVRIHDRPEHARLATSINARAFTVGSDIYFAAGKYRPGTRDGDRLIAHELAHVKQQAEGRVSAASIAPGLAMGEAGDAYEREADRCANDLSGSGTPLYARSGIYSAPQPTAAGGETIIQRDDDEDEQGLDFNLLPPSLAFRHGPFGASADTSAAQLSYFTDEGRASLGYAYGGDIYYDASLGGFRSRFGVNPGSGVASGSFGGSYEGFNFGVGGNTAGNFNLSLGYGASLLPMPYMLGQQANSAWQGAYALGGAVPEFMSDPIGAYGAHGENIDAISAFGGSLADIYGQQGPGGLPFGAGLTLSYNPEQQWVFGAGVQGSF